MRAYRDEEIPITEGDGGSVWEVEFDSFEPNKTIPEEVFTVDALGLPVGAIITDQRKSPHVTMTVGPTETDVALIEGIVGKLPSVGVPTGSAPPGATSRLRWWMLVSMGVLLVVVGFTLHRIVRRRLRQDHD